MPPRKRGKAKTAKAASSSRHTKKAPPADTPINTLKSSVPFDTNRVPVDILREILDILDGTDVKPPQALYRFMRVCRRFSDVASGAHSLWAQHVLAPMLIPGERRSQGHTLHVRRLISVLTGRAGPAPLRLHLPFFPGTNRLNELLEDFPALFARTYSITAALLTGVVAIEFFKFLRTTDVSRVEKLSLSAGWPALQVDNYGLDFPYVASASPFSDLNLPSLRELTLVNLPPPCVLKGLHSLSVKFEHHRLRTTSKDFIDYLRDLTQLTHLKLDGCLLDANGEAQPIELPHLAHVELVVAPVPCAFFLQHVQFPTTTVVSWRYEKWIRNHVNDQDPLPSLFKAINERLQPNPERQYRAVLRLSPDDKNHLNARDGLSNAFFPWSSPKSGRLTFSLYNHSDGNVAMPALEPHEQDLALRLEYLHEAEAFLSDELFLQLVQPGRVSSLTMSTLGCDASAFASHRIAGILHSFPSIKDFTWTNLTTSEKLAPVIKAVLDPSATPLLRSMRICELGHRVRDQWDVNDAAVALVAGLRSRRQAGCRLDGIPKVDVVYDLLRGVDRKSFRRGPIVPLDERLGELWRMLAEAQGNA
ncbi:unnamed protein product [Peniophora sp. CBMAI 1063]|nr:unnamed protein product [Peniophora sp. CBMAI 1063]